MTQQSSSDRPIQVGIVGAGGMAGYHFEGFTQAGAQVAAICDTNIEHAKQFAREHGIERTFSSLTDMLDGTPQIDAVSIITPNRFHCPLVLEALGRGKHVYCEKPPALNAEEVGRMLDASRQAGRILMFDFNNRARPESQAMKRYIAEGDVGRINSAQATWIRRNGIPGFGGWFTNKALAGGGSVIDLLHMIDLALYFMDYPEPAYVLARTFDTFMGNPAFKGPWGIPDTKGGVMDVESACHAMLTFKSGQCLMIRNSWAEMNEREVVSVVFQGTKAGGKVERLFARDGLDETSVDTCRLFTEEYGRQVNRDIIVPQDEAMGRIANASNFVQSVAGEQQPLNTPQEALILMRITDAIYESARTGGPVEVR